MNSDDKLRVRRAILRLIEKGEGSSVLITYKDGTVQQYEETARKFARRRKLTVSCTHQLENGGMRVTHVASQAEQRESKYAMLDALEPGQSHRFKLPSAAEVARIRMAASFRQRSVPGLRLACNTQENGDVLVTRLGPGVEPPAEVRRLGRRPVMNQVALTLSELQGTGIVSFDGVEWHQRVRLAVRTCMAANGWDLITRTRGTVIEVIRLDNLQVKQAKDIPLADHGVGPDDVG